MTGVAFIDNYPLGLGNLSAGANTCGGTVTVSGTALELAGGTVPGATTVAGSCKVTIDVTSAALNTYTNSTGNITTASSGTLASVSGTLIALAHPVVAVDFSPNVVGTTLPSVLTLTFTNTNTQLITKLAVGGPPPAALALPAGLTLHSPVQLGSTCGGTLTNSGDTILLTGGTIPASSSCKVTAVVTGNSAGSYTLSLPPGFTTSGNAGANTVAGSASLVVN